VYFDLLLINSRLKLIVQEAWMYVEELVKQKNQMSEKVIKEIHSLVFTSGTWTLSFLLFFDI